VRKKEIQGVHKIWTHQNNNIPWRLNHTEATCRKAVRDPAVPGFKNGLTLTSISNMLNAHGGVMPCKCTGYCVVSARCG
jgi:hypothetical protein